MVCAIISKWVDFQVILYHRPAIRRNATGA